MVNCKDTYDPQPNQPRPRMAAPVTRPAMAKISFNRQSIFLHEPFASELMKIKLKIEIELA